MTPIAVNGWQQGWVLPAGIGGPVTLEFGANRPYRAGLIVGLSLLPLLLALALIPPRAPARRPRHGDAPPRPWSARPAAAVAGLAACALIAGPAGCLAFGAALGAGHLLRHRRSLRDRLTLLVVPAGLIVAGVLLSRYPWRSVDGYIGHSPWVQLPAMIAVGVLCAAALPSRRGKDTAATDPP